MALDQSAAIAAAAQTSVRWVDTPEALSDTLAHLERQPLVALDTEFHRERTYFPKLALVQLAWDPDQLVLIDPLAVDVRPLAKVLESQDTTIVLHAASQDLEVLRLATGTIPRNLFDTQIAAGFLGYANPSLASLHTEILDVHLDKGDRLTNWLTRPLAASVLDYAAGDVRYLLRIHDHLVDKLGEMGRLRWAEDECALLRESGEVERDPDDAWKKVKDVRRLGAAAQGVARSVAAWRDARAAALDIPVRHVLGDLAVVGIAQRPPRSLDALRAVRGIDGRLLNGSHANDLLEAIAAGVRAGPPPRSERPHSQPPRDLRPAVTLLSSWVSQFAKEQHIDTQLLATRSDIEDFVGGNGQGRLGSGWRRDLVGEPMEQLLTGHAALAFTPERGIILEPRISPE